MSVSHLSRWRLVTTMMILVALSLGSALIPSTALAAPARLAAYDFAVAGQEADTGAFAVPAGRNRTVVIAVHARTDVGPTADYVTVDWARLNGDVAQPFTKVREVFRSSAPMHQSTTLLYRHLDNAVSGDCTVRVRMANNLTDEKVVFVHVMGNLDPAFNPVVGDANGSHSSGLGTQAIIGRAADVDYVVFDAATHNSASAANVTGRAPAAKVWTQINNDDAGIKALNAYHVKASSGSVNYSYNMSASDHWSIVAVRFRAAYTIEASAGPNGMIDPAGEVPVLSGGDRAFEIAADANYVIAQLLVNGVPITDAAGEETYIYGFVNVTEDAVIEVTFSGRPMLEVDPATVDMECDATGYTLAMAMEGVSAIDPEDGDITGDVVAGNVSFPLVAPGVYTILYDVVDSDGTPAAQQQRVLTIADTLPPVITLNRGSSVLFVECGVDTYEELGAVALDQCDGEVAVAISGDTVDEMVLGEYSIHYNAVDAEGLVADEQVLTVHVVDTQGPVVTLLTESDTVVLDGGASYYEAGATAWDACEGDILPEFIIVGGDDVNTGLIGTQYVTYTALDSWGNENTGTLNVIVQRVACALIVNVSDTDIFATPGSAVTLSIAMDAASCNVGPLSYEWLKRDADKADFVALPGAPSAPALTIASVSDGDASVYRCDVSDDMYTVSSAEMTLTVGSGLPAAGAVALAGLSMLAALSGAFALRRRR